MSARYEWTPEQLAAIRDGNAAGKSLHSIAADLGVTKRNLSNQAARMGLTWDRSRTQSATAARVADAKARRAALVLRSLARAEHLYDRLEAPEFTTLTRGTGGAEHTETLKFVPARDERELAVTIRTHLDASMRLEGHDAGTGAQAVIGLLQQTAAALGITDAPDDDAPTT